MVNKHYPQQFKADAVVLYRSRPGATIASIADDLGVNRETLRSWVLCRARHKTQLGEAVAAAGSDQVGEPAGQVADGGQVRAEAAQALEFGLVFVGEFVDRAHDPAGDVPGGRRRWWHWRWGVAAPDADQPAAQCPLCSLVAASADLGQELVCADDSFGDALVQVGLEDVEDAVPGAAVRAEQVRRCGGVGVAAHGLGVQAELAGDRVDTDALLAQGVDVGVPGPGALLA